MIFTEISDSLEIIYGLSPRCNGLEGTKSPLSIAQIARQTPGLNLGAIPFGDIQPMTLDRIVSLLARLMDGSGGSTRVAIVTLALKH